MTQIFASVHMPVNNRESARSIYFGITNKFYKVGEFENIKSTNNEKQLYSVSWELPVTAWIQYG